MFDGATHSHVVMAGRIKNSILLQNCRLVFPGLGRMPGPEIMIGMCVGVKLDLRPVCCLKRPRAAPTQHTTLSKKPTEGPRKESKVFSHPMHLWC